MRDIVAAAEDNYAHAKDFPDAPINFEDAMENYKKVLEVIGDLAANRIAPRAPEVDHEGATLHDGIVIVREGNAKKSEGASASRFDGNDHFRANTAD